VNADAAAQAARQSKRNAVMNPFRKRQGQRPLGADARKKADVPQGPLP
jgi:hypothetical protein